MRVLLAGRPELSNQVQRETLRRRSNPHHRPDISRCDTHSQQGRNPSRSQTPERTYQERQIKNFQNHRLRIL